MPFQVSFSAKTTPKGIITNFTAGPDQVVVCDTTVFLEATVNGDLTGHTFLWEQIDGDPVTFLTPLNQFAISYTTANFLDKTFRFFIDKGTGIEQFDDVFMFSTPTLPLVTGVPDQNCIINTGGSLHCDKPLLTIDIVMPTTFLPEPVIACNINTDPILVWTPQCKSEIIIQYVVQYRLSAGPWIDEVILPPTTLQHVPTVLGATYQVVAVYRESNSAINSVASDSIWWDGTLRTRSTKLGGVIGAVVDMSMNISTHRAREETVLIPSYSVSLLTLLTCDPDAPEDMNLTETSGSDKNVVIPTYTVLDLSLISCAPDAPEDMNLTETSGSDLLVLIPTYSVLDLHGGDIGG